MKTFLNKLILFFTGYCMYIAIEVSFRGYSYVLMGIVAGIIFLLIDPINDQISWDIPLPVQMMISTFIILLLELLSGEFSLHILGIRMWDYRNLPFSMFEGLICPQFALIWYFLSGIAIVLCDCINYYLMHDPIDPYYKFTWNGQKHYLPKRECDK